MELVYFNGKYMPKEEVWISPDDRGFLLADGVYEVVRWYGNGFFDMDGHIARLKRSLNELRINWEQTDHFSQYAEDLVRLNRLSTGNAMVYLQVTRGAARRSHTFPPPGTMPTVYSYAWDFTPDKDSREKGIKVALKEDIRWKRCDIKSIALLPNTLLFQEAYSKGQMECIFSRDGLITECSHSNVAFVIGGKIFTHPESDLILSGITRKNVIRMAKKAGIEVVEEAVQTKNLSKVEEAFIMNTSSEITPVIEIGRVTVGSGAPGALTRLLQEKFDAETIALKRLES